MLSVYPFGSGSLYTASFAITASYAQQTQRYLYVESASVAGKVLYPRPGAMGKGVCLLTTQQYLALKANPSWLEICPFPDETISEPIITSPTVEVVGIEIIPSGIQISSSLAVSASHAVKTGLVQFPDSASIAAYAINSAGPQGSAGLTVTAVYP